MRSDCIFVNRGGLIGMISAIFLELGQPQQKFEALWKLFRGQTIVRYKKFDLERLAAIL